MAIRKRETMVAIVDDDDLMRSALQGLLKSVGPPAQDGNRISFLFVGNRVQDDPAVVPVNHFFPRSTTQPLWGDLPISFLYFCGGTSGLPYFTPKVSAPV